jgi:hypothetical protein
VVAGNDATTIQKERKRENQREKQEHLYNQNARKQKRKTKELCTLYFIYSKKTGMPKIFLITSRRQNFIQFDFGKQQQILPGRIDIKHKP